MIFANRQKAGQLLAKKLAAKNFKNPLVLALLRGGLPLGAQIAKSLSCPLDIITVKKISSLQNPELALGAVAPDSTIFWEEKTSSFYDQKDLARYAKKADQQRKHKDNYLRQKKPYHLKEKTIILVDDGLATGATALAALKWLKTKKPKKIILAVPVSPPDTLKKITPFVDDIVCLHVEPNFYAVSQFYQHFDQLTDQKVKKILSSF